MVWTAVLGLSLLSPEAAAAWPDDITLSVMDSWQEERVDPEDVSVAYDQLLMELGSMVANKPTNPAETLGVNGFDVGFATSISFISTAGDNADPSPWQRAHVDGEPTAVGVVPRIQVRKGLPLSMEVGGNFGYIAVSRQTVVSGFGRWGLVEGYRNFPDVNLQVGYSGYVGNSELELGVMDVSGTIGYSLPFGTLVGINETIFSPFAGVGQLTLHAAPRMSAEEQEALGVREVSAFNGADIEIKDENFKATQFHGGFRILKGTYQFHLSAVGSARVVPTVTLGMGFVY